MTNIIDRGESLEVYGKSGNSYQARIYSDKNSTSNISSPAIVCLTNSRYTNSGWEHQVKGIYNTDDPEEALRHFKEREDVTHLILIPEITDQYVSIDKVADLIQNYIHK